MNCCIASDGVACSAVLGHAGLDAVERTTSIVAWRTIAVSFLHYSVPGKEKSLYNLVLSSLIVRFRCQIAETGGNAVTLNSKAYN